MDQALKFTAALDLLILDAPPNSNAPTLKIAQGSDAVILPTGLSLMTCSPRVACSRDGEKKDFEEQNCLRPMPGRR